MNAETPSSQGSTRDVTGVVLSFVVPVYNEAESLPRLHNLLRGEADRLGEPYEIIFVNDGSTDASLDIVQRLHAEDDRVKYVDLSRNFGHQEALTAGYDRAAGQAVISLDADGQHPPAMIGELVGRWRQGYEVVYTVKVSTQHLRRWKRWTGALFYRAVTLLSGMDVGDQADFRLLDRKVVDALRRAREKARFLRGLVRWMGFRQIGVEYEVAARIGGASGYTLGKMIRTGAAGLLGFSVMPLRLILLAGAALLSVALVYAVAALICWPIFGTSLAWNLLMLVVGLVGLQLSATGLLGEYLGRVYEEAKNRPIYVVREACGFEAPVAESADQAEPPARVRPAEPGRIRLFT